jgi:signal transduction histidine kinase
VLAEFAAFLKAGHLDEVAADNMRRWRQLDLPLTRLFADVPDAELLPRFRSSLETFCDDLIAGRRFWRLREVLKLWEEDRLPGVPRDGIEPSDLVLANAAQREAIWAFIPRFTRDVDVAMRIVEELNGLIQAAKADAFEIFVRQREDLREATAALAAEVREHQQAELKLSRHTMRLHVLAELSGDVAGAARDPRAFTAAVAHRAADLLDASCFVHLLDEAGANWVLAASHGPDDALHQAMVERMTGWELPLELHPMHPYEEPLLVPDAANPPPGLARLSQLRPEGRVPMRSLVCVPLRTRDALVGMLSGVRLGEAPPFDEEDVEFLQDLGDRTAMALENAGLYEDLERRVEARTRELSQINAELEAFSYSVSHDLRGPLRGIDGFSQALVEDYGDQLDPTAHGYLERVRAATRRMGELIDALLELARLARVPLRRQRVDLSALANAALAELREGSDRQVELQIEPGLVVDGDPRLLRVVLDNLLGNAWKYTAKRELGRIGLRCFSQEGETVYEVKDNGAGFDMAYADKLFRPFGRLHGLHDFAGSGVGLATVQRIVARHGGRIWGEGAPGEGATFWFTLGT